MTKLTKKEKLDIFYSIVEKMAHANSMECPIFFYEGKLYGNYCGFFEVLYEGRLDHDAKIIDADFYLNILRHVIYNNSIKVHVPTKNAPHFIVHTKVRIWSGHTSDKLTMSYSPLKSFTGMEPVAFIEQCIIEKSIKKIKAQPTKKPRSL